MLPICKHNGINKERVKSISTETLQAKWNLVYYLSEPPGRRAGHVTVELSLLAPHLAWCVLCSFNQIFKVINKNLKKEQSLQLKISARYAIAMNLTIAE